VVITNEELVPTSGMVYTDDAAGAVALMVVVFVTPRVN